MRRLVQGGFAASCYFRSSVEPPYRKALLQITERCNLACAHCFVSAGNYGSHMALAEIQEKVLPRLMECRVRSVTLTGGEPLVHPEFLEIVRLFRKAKIRVGICTNGSLLTPEMADALAEIGDIHVNVSLDGFRPESHGKFRGNAASFARTLAGIQEASRGGILQGFLVTPNRLAAAEEYADLCRYAIEMKAKYVLMNPLSRFGRGVVSREKLAARDEVMNEISELTAPFEAEGLDVVRIRFPNDELPLAACDAGNIIYSFADGSIAICPYLVFAARTPGSQHAPEEFTVGNILTDADIAQKLDSYRFADRYPMGLNEHCRECGLDSDCGKGCPAAVVAAGNRIGDVDYDVCPRPLPGGQ